MDQEKLRIGIVCYPTYGGSGAVATELGRLLARRGHVIHFISYARPFRLIDDFHPNIFYHEVSSESYPLFQGQLYTISVAVKMAEIIRHVGLDLLHVHYALPHALSAGLAIEMLPPEQRIPTVTTLHGTDITLVGSNPAFLPVVRMGLARSDAVVSVSHWLAEETRRRFGLCAKGPRCGVIHNFVDPEIYRPDLPGPAPRSRFAAADEKILCHISNFRPVKRVADVVRVFARVAAERPSRLLMVGDGPDRATAYETARALNVADRVQFLGFQDNVPGLLALSDLLLFPSEYESFGLAVLEALATELPVVCSDGGGLPEVMVQGETGYMCPVGDVDAMARRALEILADPELATRMGRAGRRRALEHFHPDRIVGAYERLYQHLIEGDAECFPEQASAAESGSLSSKPA